VTTLLFVCTGNMCRSPLMERILREGLRARGITDIDVISAGTHAYDGDPMHRHADVVLTQRGIVASDFAGRYLTEKVLADVDIVVGASREHRSAAVRLRPALLNRAFTLRELARICATLDEAELPAGPPSERLTALVRLAAARRTMTLPANPADDDLIDPLNGPVEDFATCAVAVDDLLRPLLDLVAPGESTATP
jgi:protein-tyrosine phosphatase